MKVFVFLCFWLFFLTISAQEINIDIIITGLDNEPIPGVFVISKNKGKTIAISGKDGNAKFQIQNRDILIFEAMGYNVRKISSSEIKRRDTVIINKSLEKLGEVIISDNYADKRKKEVSNTIEIINNEFITSQLEGGLANSLERLPGVSTVKTGSGNNKPVLRGLSFNRISIYENGIKHEAQQWGKDHGLEIDKYSVKIAEIIKGPASLRYGADAIGGVINIVDNTVPQQNSTGGSISSGYNSNNNGFSGSLNINKRFNKFFIDSRISALKRSDASVPTDNIDVYSYKVNLKDSKLRNTAGKNLSTHLTLGYLTNKVCSRLFVSNFYQKSGFFANAHGLEPRNVDENKHDNSIWNILYPSKMVNHFKLINRTVIKKEKFKTTINLGYQRNFRKELNDYIEHGYMPSVLPDSFENNLERLFKKEVLSANFSNKHEYSKNKFEYGINSQYTKNNAKGWSFIIPSFREFNLGVFIHNKYKFNSKASLNGGLRYDYGVIKSIEEHDWFETPVIDGNDTSYSFLQRAKNLRKEYSNFSGAIGINYNLKHYSFKANIGKSFRMPEAKELASNGINYHHFAYEKGNKDLSPEVSYQIDFSLKTHYSSWAIEISPFINYFPNYIYLNPTSQYDYQYGAGNQIYEYRQSKVIRYGGEIHSHYNITNYLRLGLIGEYIYSEQKSGEKQGFSLPFSPPPEILFNINYKPALKTEILKNTFIATDLILKSKQENIVPPEVKTEGYNSINVSAGTKIKTGKSFIGLNAKVKNLLNRKYFNHTSFHRVINIPEPGRTFLINLDYKF